MSARRPAGVVAASLLLAACGTSGNDPQADADTASPRPTASATVSAGPTAAPVPTPTPTPVFTPSAGPTASAGPTDAPSPAATPLEASVCSEPELDTSGVEIVTVRLTRTGDTIVVTFTDDQPAPSGVNLLWSIWAQRTDGDTTRVVQLGAEYADGKNVAHFVFADGAQTNLDGPMKVAGKKMTAEFPAAPVVSLGEGARWYATLTVEQETTDYCPGGRGVDRKKIKGIAFPASWF